MPFSSPFPPLDIPKVDLLSYIFPPSSTPSDTPIWIDAKNPQHSLSPRQLLQWTKRLGYGLDGLGIKRGDAVVIFTPNHIFVPVVYFGVVGTGRVFSGLNPNYTASEAAHQLQNTEAKVVLVHPSLVGTAIKAAKQINFPRNRLYLFSDHRNNAVHGIKDWRSLTGSFEQGERYTWHRMNEKEAETTLATLNYSSGTTGRPKGVAISHYNIVANIEQTIFMRFLHKKTRRQERWLGFLPLYHAYAQLYTIVMAVKLHIPVYLMKEFHFEDFLRAIQAYKITNLQVAPPILVMLNKRPETTKYDLTSVTDVLCGAAPLSSELQNKVAGRFNLQINQGWGMTETVCGAHHVPGGTKDDSGSVGQLFPNCECKLLDDNGNEVAPGQPGEMYIRGPQVCMGYWKNKKATKEALSPDGWLRTGDVAIVRDGWFWIVDRKKELIKVNGLQVAPAELEAVLLEFNQIADAAVVGITINGEEWPRAYIHLEDCAKGRIKESDIQNYMQTKVAKHKQLVGGISFIDEVPKLPSGKIVRKMLKEWSKRDALALEENYRAKL
ncbi:hypothetical protein AJ79_04914 [Helicocarpus griseus UAMH5409]|uniref:AMP-dependent synthetase/ligase domain-containing protein n=1 Tax=Helicocarpus griseus UAMH5409 TaxID=1447875 RepID=A0A2B7XRM7_9EURO|nr:hypothetical protein AJ79_04914 [Helicocarpus griseus UAMH5409]